MLAIRNSKVPLNIIIWPNKDVSTMLVFNIILNFYWSKKFVDLRITD